MSALDFQRVMAHLIRFPAESLDSICGRLGNLDLDSREMHRLMRMAEDPLVRKFGRKMSYCRRRDAVQVMRASKNVIPEHFLDYLFYELFDPGHATTDFVLLGVHFLEFLLSDERCDGVLDQCPVFARDCLRYDLARALVVRQVLRVPDPSLPAGSLLAHGAFTIIDLNHDVPAVDRLKLRNPGVTTEPRSAAMKLLFTRAVSSPFYQMFQIDDVVGNFLSTQRKDPAAWNGILPEAFDGMVKIGLCRRPSR